MGLSEMVLSAKRPPVRVLPWEQFRFDSMDNPVVDYLLEYLHPGADEGNWTPAFRASWIFPKFGDRHHVNKAEQRWNVVTSIYVVEQRKEPRVERREFLVNFNHDAVCARRFSRRLFMNSSEEFHRSDRRWPWGWLWLSEGR